MKKQWIPVVASDGRIVLRHETQTEENLTRFLEGIEEIVAKKLNFRAADFKARDLFDLALVLEYEPTAISPLAHLIRIKEDLLTERFRSRDAELREDFQALDVLDFNPSFDTCLKLVEKVGGVHLH